MDKKKATIKGRKIYNKEILQRYLLPLSQSDDPDEMMKEWEKVCIHSAWTAAPEEVTDEKGKWLPTVHFVPSKRKYDGACSGIDCPCSHANIHRLCYIRNQITDEIVIVGCVCVVRFMDIHIPTDFWSTLERMALRKAVIPTQEILDQLPPHSLNPYETNFLPSIREWVEKGRRLTVKQKKVLLRINRNILFQIHYWHMSQTDDQFNRLSKYAKTDLIYRLLNDLFNTLTQKKEAEKRKRDLKKKQQLVNKT